MRGSAVRRLFALAVTASVLAIPGKPSFSAESRETSTLRGAGALKVFVRLKVGDAGAQRLGLTQNQLQTDLEAKLKKAAIPLAKNAGSYLVLSVSILSISHPTVDGILAYVSTAQLKFLQGATLDANGQRATVTTWDEVRFGAMSPAKDLDKRIRGSIGGLVDKFVADYLAENPAP